MLSHAALCCQSNDRHETCIENVLGSENLENASFIVFVLHVLRCDRLSCSVKCLDEKNVIYFSIFKNSS